MSIGKEIDKIRRPLGELHCLYRDPYEKPNTPSKRTCNLVNQSKTFKKV